MLVELLNENVVSVKFTKKDGSVRVMRCTKNLDLIPQDKHPKGASRNTTSDAVVAFDLDINEWRSFLPASVIESCVVD